MKKISLVLCFVLLLVAMLALSVFAATINNIVGDADLVEDGGCGEVSAEMIRDGNVNTAASCGSAASWVNFHFLYEEGVNVSKVVVVVNSTGNVYYGDTDGVATSVKEYTELSTLPNIYLRLFNSTSSSAVYALENVALTDDEGNVLYTTYTFDLGGTVYSDIVKVEVATVHGGSKEMGIWEVEIYDYNCVDEADHIYTDATCSTLSTCTVCGVTTGELAPDNHVWVEATCSAAKHCSEEACGLVVGDPLPHTLGTDDGDCSTSMKCHVCHAIAVAAISHNYDADGKCTNANCVCIRSENNITQNATVTVAGSKIWWAVRYYNVIDGDLSTASHSPQYTSSYTYTFDYTTEYLLSRIKVYVNGTATNLYDPTIEDQMHNGTVAKFTDSNAVTSMVITLRDSDGYVVYTTEQLINLKDLTEYDFVLPYTYKASKIEITFDGTEMWGSQCLREIQIFDTDVPRNPPAVEKNIAADATVTVSGGNQWWALRYYNVIDGNTDTGSHSPQGTSSYTYIFNYAQKQLLSKIKVYVNGTATNVYVESFENQIHNATSAGFTDSNAITSMVITLRDSEGYIVYTTEAAISLEDLLEYELVLPYTYYASTVEITFDGTEMWGSQCLREIEIYNTDTPRLPEGEEANECWKDINIADPSAIKDAYYDDFTYVADRGDFFYVMDDEGNFILDENGNRIFYCGVLQGGTGRFVFTNGELDGLDSTGTCVYFELQQNSIQYVFKETFLIKEITVSYIASNNANDGYTLWIGNVIDGEEVWTQVQDFTVPEINKLSTTTFTVGENGEGIEGSMFRFCWKPGTSKRLYPSLTEIDIIAGMNDCQWEEKEVLVEGNCGYDRKVLCVCTACGAEKVVVTPASGEHTFEIITAAKAATCTDFGYNAVKHCTTCDKTFGGDRIAKALGHDMSVAATCTAPKSCSRCDYTEGNALGHSYAETGRVDATYDAPGSITYTCSNCDDSYTEVIPQLTRPAIEVANESEFAAALNNAVDGDVIRLTASFSLKSSSMYTITKAVTVDINGQTLTTERSRGSLTLDNPGCSIISSVEGGTIVHKYGIAIIIVKHADRIENVTLTSDRATAGTSGGISIRGAGAHINLIKDVTINGPHLSYGIEGYQCATTAEAAANVVVDEMINVVIDAQRCGIKLDANYGTATNCTFKGGVSGIEIQASDDDKSQLAKITLVDCTVEGGTQAVYANGYATYNIDFTADEATSFTNTNNGLVFNFVNYGSANNVTLTAPGYVYVDGVVKCASEHNYVATVVEPTCTEEGYTKYSCSRCVEYYVENKVAPLGHTEAVIEAVAPTCSTVGLTEGKKCSVCNTILVAQEEIAMVEHEFVETSRDEAVEGVDGKIYYTCKNCSATKEESLCGHTYEVIDEAEATCTADGYKTFECSKCHFTYTEEIKATGHKYSWNKEVKNADGTITFVQEYGCEICGANDFVKLVSTWSELMTAVNNANAGDIIRLSADITMPSTGTITAFTIEKYVVIDLGGFTVKSNDVNKWAIFSLKGLKAFGNGKIEHYGESSQALKVYRVDLIADLTIDVLAKKSSVGGITLYNYNSGQAHIGLLENVTIYANNNGIETYNAYNNEGLNVIGAMNNVVVETEGQALNLNTTCGPITDSTFKGTNIAIQFAKLDGNFELCGNCVVEGGVAAIQVDSAAAGATFSASDDTKFTTKGILFNASSALKESNDLGVIETTVASVNGKLYKSLEEAVAAVNASTEDVTTLALMSDLVVTETIIINKNIIISLGGGKYDYIKDGNVANTITVPGYTITALGNGEIFRIVENGVLTMSGIGTVNSVGNANGVAFVVDGGKLVINGGSYTNMGAGDIISVSNEGIVEISAGTFYAYDPANYVVDTSCSLLVDGSYVVDSHVVVEDVATAPDCTNTGLTAGSHCSRCETVLVPQEEIAALGHTWVDATCTTAKTCSVCSATEGEALGHSFTYGEDYVYVPSTCIAAGYESDVCSVCGETFTVNKEIDTEWGHEWDAGVRNEANTGTIYTCALCKDTKEEITMGTASEPIEIVAGTNNVTVYVEGSDSVWYVYNVTEYGYVTITIADTAGIKYSANTMALYRASYNTGSTTYTFAVDPEMSSTFAVVISNNYEDAENNINYVLPTSFDVAFEAANAPELVVGENAVTGTSEGNRVVVTTPGSYILSAAEGEENAVVNITYVHPMFGKITESVDLPYEFEVAEGQTMSFIINTADWSESDEINLVLANAHTHEYTAVVTEPTCTTNGFTTYTCSCGESYTDNVVEALGHTEVVIPAVPSTMDGNKVVTPGTTSGLVCEVCGEVTLDTEATNKGLYIDARSLNVSENLKIIYKAYVPSGYTNVYMTFDYNGQVITLTEYSVDDKGRYCFDFTSVTPQFMNINIAATVHASNGNRESTFINPEYSIKTYCLNTLAKNYSDALNTALIDLLVYGAKLQVYTNTNVDNLATDGVDLSNMSIFEELGADYDKRTESEEKSEIAYWDAVSLNVSSTVNVIFKFYATDINGLQVKFSISDRSVMVDASSLTKDSKGRYEAKFTNVTAIEFDEVITAEFFVNGEKIDGTMTYSINSYIQRYQNYNNAKLTDCLKALYNYGESIYRYAYKTGYGH